MGELIIKCLFFLLLQCFVIYSPDAYAEFHGSFTATSNYVWRGYSKSDGKFAFQVNFDYEHASGFYMGTSASTVDFGDQGYDEPARFEITPYLGWNFNIVEDWRLDFQWTRYFYDGKLFGEFSDYNEFYWLVHYSDIFTGRISFSEDYYSRGHAAGDFELTGRYPLSDWLEFSGGTGYSLTKDTLEYDYLYWNAGLSIYMKYAVMDLRYKDAWHTVKTVTGSGYNGRAQYPEAIGATFVFSISVGF